MTPYTTGVDCRYCIDGALPIGRLPDLGAVFGSCPTCQPICRWCHGAAVWPTETRLDHFLSRMATSGVHVALCPGCDGVLPSHHPREVTP